MTFDFGLISKFSILTPSYMVQASVFCSWRMSVALGARYLWTTDIRYSGASTILMNSKRAQKVQKVTVKLSYDLLSY